MADPKDVAFELNVFGEEPRCHLKLTGPGTPPLEFVVSAFKRLDDATTLWNETREHYQAPQETAETPPAPRPTPRRPSSSSTTIRDPDAPASKSQVGMIRGMCGRIEDSKAAIAALAPLGDFAGSYDKGGHYIPSWDALNELTKGEAGQAIDALKELEGVQKQGAELPFE